MSNIAIALCQINPTVGDFDGNRKKILASAIEASSNGAQVMVFPECAISGYPAEDLFLRPQFIKKAEATLENLCAELPAEALCIIGSPSKSNNHKAHNSAVIIHQNKIQARYHKQNLPNYGVFDEQRIFSEGQEALVLNINNALVAIHICEDSWDITHPAVEELNGIPLSAIINLSASPFHAEKLLRREKFLGELSKKLNAPLLYCNLVGGQDELVFDGRSMQVDPSGNITQLAKGFEEDILYSNIPVKKNKQAFPENTLGFTLNDTKVGFAVPSEPLTSTNVCADLHAALCLGLRDYVHKNGFQKVLIALSGGIDSALVATLAVDALGADAVHAVTMPSQYSSEGTYQDALLLAKNLGISIDSLSIQSLFEAYLKELEPLWPDTKPNVAEENIQARIRGNLIMALSNKFGWLVLATGNKSELATGYCTLYGDMAGGFAVIKDLLKTEVFALCEWINQEAGSERIPKSTITRPPSAELRPDQKDSDSLPPYDILDPILEAYVENDCSAETIIAQGFDPKTVERIIRLVDRNEYKRRQAPIGIKLSPKAFGRDRRIPITQKQTANEQFTPSNDRG